MAKKNTANDADQLVIPEMAPRRIDSIHKAAKRYATERDERIQANKDEKDAHEHLLKVMKDNGLTSYVYGDLSVFVDESVKCKVKIGEAKTGDNGDE